MPACGLGRAELAGRGYPPLQCSRPMEVETQTRTVATIAFPPRQGGNSTSTMQLMRPDPYDRICALV